MKVNYQKELEALLAVLEKEKRVPRLLLHACCAPCSSYVLEYLSRYFEITVFYYNPNISPEEEYRKRVSEIRRLIGEMKFIHGLEDVPEGGERCFRCYRLRLAETARLAQEGDYDFFTTTLSISPLKNAQKLNEIGEVLGESFQVRHLPSDFKKKDGYKRSVELSAEHGLYRQDYCGCVYSKRMRERQKAEE